MDMIQLGRFALPIAPMLLFAGLAAGLAVAWFGAGSQRSRVESALFNIALAGAAGARAGFVAKYWSAFQSAPFGMLDIRDGGFALWPGIAAALAAGLAYLARAPSLRRPLLASIASASFVILLGGLLLPAAQPLRAALPTAAFQTVHGGDLRLDAFRGKALVVNLWATWCPPCRREMPMLQRAQAQRRDVAFVFADQGEEVEVVTRYLASERLTLANVILDPNRILARHTGSPVLPTTLVFDRDGVLQAVRAGQLSEATLTQLLEMRND